MLCESFAHFVKNTLYKPVFQVFGLRPIASLSIIDIAICRQISYIAMTGESIPSIYYFRGNISVNENCIMEGRICTKINYIECNLSKNLNAAADEYCIANAQHRRTEYQSETCLEYVG